MNRTRSIFFFIFAVSGFSGLIYESIWSHYLKLLLGHAAYAQSLVLMTFMGGMALGSWLASRYSRRWGNLLRVYALVEGTVGLLALVFHRSFTGLSALLDQTVIPALGSVHTVHFVKWSAGALMILPQSVLLGATFPLMAAGIIRRFPTGSGGSIATLYFCNSIGAAIGVLASGFWLIAAVGLPGTILTAGLLNIALAVLVWRLAAAPESAGVDATASANRDPGQRRWLYGLLGVSLATGLASFIYEMGWIRMLSLVLGSATHSFELMLSAFILGLALGGLWIRRRIDNIANVPAYLAAVQLIMGSLALLSLAIYGQTFKAMTWLLAALNRTDQGYTVFMFAGHLLCLLIMLPATFCAGMTLPLITYSLLRQGQGEKSIGAVYASNTLGGILGVLFAVHFGMPLLGLKGLIVTGAAVDIAMGLALLAALYAIRPPRRYAFVTVIAGITLLITVFAVHLDPHQMASGVYRYARAQVPSAVEMLYHRDGKTATINVTRTRDQEVAILTNGKPDAAIAMDPEAELTGDEATMVLLGALPLALRPEAKTVANIGLGSGLTTSTLLASRAIERVDTIEIEAAVVEGAESFRPRVNRAYDDARSTIFIEDAKTFFSSRQSRYDIIVSEPSNPWVSGVSSLFSDEFYARVADHLAPGGILVQWVQLYEIDIELVASIAKAIANNFADYAIYTSNGLDMLIVSTDTGGLTHIDPVIFTEPDLAAELRTIDVHNIGDMSALRIGGKALLDPLFASYDVPANSDYFPYLDLYAPRARYLGLNATRLEAITHAPIPLLQLLDDGAKASVRAQIGVNPFAPRDRWASNGYSIAKYILEGIWDHSAVPLEEAAKGYAQVVRRGADRCESEDDRLSWLTGLYELTVHSLTLRHPRDNEILWDHLSGLVCAQLLEGDERTWFELLGAVNSHDAHTFGDLARSLLSSEPADVLPEKRSFLVAAAMLASLHQGESGKAFELWNQYRDPEWDLDSVDVYLRLLVAHAVYGNAIEDKL
jgi:predicted membrane-bound spermidine synthase